MTYVSLQNEVSTASHVIFYPLKQNFITDKFKM